MRWPLRARVGGGGEVAAEGRGWEGVVRARVGGGGEVAAEGEGGRGW